MLKTNPSKAFRSPLGQKGLRRDVETPEAAWHDARELSGPFFDPVHPVCKAKSGHDDMCVLPIATDPKCDVINNSGRQMRRARRLGPCERHGQPWPLLL